MENEARKKLEEQKKKRAELNKEMNLDLMSYRISQGISRPHTFSYFQHAPQQKDTSSSKKAADTSSSEKVADTSSSKKITKTRTEKK